MLALSGCGFLYTAVVEDSHSLKAWLLPFGPWSCAVSCFLSLRQRN